MTERAKRSSIEEVLAPRSSGIQRREGILSEDPRVEPDRNERAMAPTERPPAGLGARLGGLPPRPSRPAPSRDVHTYLVSLAIEAGADPVRAHERLAGAAASWTVERMERAALVDAYLRNDVAAILRMVQQHAEDAEP